MFGFGGSQQTPSAQPQQRTRNTVLAYARPDAGALISPPEKRPNPEAAVDRYTATYDIRSRTLRMPNGDVLEAHSGLGPLMDDVNHVHVKMHGPTPPNVYKLEWRKKLFHGVKAVRMIPVGDGNMFGRDGILVHSYLLGPNGDSNGCISVKDYERFREAFANGQVTKIHVIGRS